MIQLYAVVEGETEQEFFKHVVAPHLVRFDVFATPIAVLTKRERDGRKHKGGGDWTKWKEDILRYRLDQRPSVRITTLFDLYGLPKNFPELEQHARLSDTAARATALEQAMLREIDDTRFIPYLQRHEFEALVLASLPALEKLLEGPEDRAGLQRLRDQLGSLAPEDVNDGRATAPSKRLQSFIPSYNPGDRRKGEGKSVYGPLVTEETGLAALRAQCPRFDAWISRLETLSDQAGHPGALQRSIM